MREVRDVSAEMVAQLTACDRLVRVIDDVTASEAADDADVMRRLLRVMHAAMDVCDAHETLRDLCARYDATWRPTRVGEH